MNVNLRIAKAAVRSALAESVTNATPLRALLVIKSQQQFQVISAGGIKSVSANGEHVQLSGVSGDGPTPADLMVMWEFLIEKFDLAVQDLGGGTPTDAQVEAQIETYLRPMAGYVDNYMYLTK